MGKKPGLGRKKTFKIFIYILLFSGAAVASIPFVWLLRSSFMEMGQIFIFPPEWIPDPFRWQNYPEALTVVPFARYFINTMLIVAGVEGGVLLTSTLSAFTFARLWNTINFPNAALRSDIDPHFYLMEIFKRS